MKWCIYAVLIAPFLTVLTPSMFLTHWAFLSLLIFSSWMRALSLFLASCLFPTPAWWILPRRHSTWALIAANDSLLLICPTISAFSWSLPPSGLPSASTGSWAWTQPWFLSSHGHPDLLLQMLQSRSLLSHQTHIIFAQVDLFDQMVSLWLLDQFSLLFFCSQHSILLLFSLWLFSVDSFY